LQRGAGAVAHAVGGGALEVAAELERVLVGDPGEVGRDVQVRVGGGGDRVAAHAADVDEAREVVHVGDADVRGVERAGVDAQALGVDLVVDVDDLREVV